MIKQWIFIIITLLLVVASGAVAEEKVVMEIEGMSCNLCPVAVKKSLSEIEGAKDITVSFKERKAWLSVDESVTDETLTEAVQKAGPFKGKFVERKLSISGG